jgi:hypothetical protein
MKKKSYIKKSKGRGNSSKKGKQMTGHNRKFVESDKFQQQNRKAVKGNHAN